MPDALRYRIDSLRHHLHSIVWRGLVLVAVFACGLVALSLGAEFSERPGVTHGDLSTRVYYTLGLFVLGGLDLGTPTGSPPLARTLLWIAFFAAPAVTTASVVEGLVRAFSPTRWRLRRLRHHVIVAGCGRLGRLYLKELRRSRPHKPVVMVDLRADHPAATEIQDVYRAQFLVGDIRQEAVLDALRLDRADRVLLFTGDDFVNLDAAATILGRAPALAERTVVHVANLHFVRLITNTRVARECSVVNKYQVAASELVHASLIDHFQRTARLDVVVLAGFGRFGQTVLDELQKQARDTFDRVIIIDIKAGEGAALFAQEVGFDNFYQHQVIEGDLRDPRVWQRVADIDHAEPVFIIGSGDDGINLSTALRVQSAFPRAHIVARSFYRSSFADELSRDRGISTVSIADLVARSIPESWFGRRWGAPGRKKARSRGTARERRR